MTQKVLSIQLVCCSKKVIVCSVERERERERESFQTSLTVDLNFCTGFRKNHKIKCKLKKSNANLRNLKTIFYITTVVFTKFFIWLYVCFQFDMADAYPYVLFEKPFLYYLNLLRCVQLWCRNFRFVTCPSFISSWIFISNLSFQCQFSCSVSVARVGDHFQCS